MKETPALIYILDINWGDVVTNKMKLILYHTKFPRRIVNKLLFLNI